MVAIVLLEATQTKSPTSNDPSGDDDGNQDTDFDDGKDIVEEDAATSREGVYKTGNRRDGDGNTVNGSFAELVFSFVGIRRLHDAQCAVYAVAGHVANTYEADTKQDTAQKDRSFLVSGPWEHILKVVQFPSGSRNGLLDSVNHIARDVEPVLDEDVCSRQTVDATKDPHENGHSGAPDTLHHFCRATEDPRS